MTVGCQCLTREFIVASHRLALGIGARTWAAITMVVALAAVFLVGPAAQCSDATTISVANETQYRNALATLSSAGATPHVIEITASFDVTDTLGDPTYSGSGSLNSR